MSDTHPYKTRKNWQKLKLEKRQKREGAELKDRTGRESGTRGEIHFKKLVGANPKFQIFFFYIGPTSFPAENREEGGMESQDRHAR